MVIPVLSMPISISTIHAANLAIGLNALENKIEHTSTLSRRCVEDGCDKRNSEPNSLKKTGTSAPLSTPHWPTYAASLIGGRFLLMSGAIVLHLSFIAYANDFDDAPQVKPLAKGMSEDIAFFIARTAECNHWAGKEPYDKDRANYIRNAVEKAGCENLVGLEMKLREKYRGQPKLLDAIENAKHLLM